jgi:hypothetical protein
MAGDHYLPAAFLARFSYEKSMPMRNRRVWVLRAGQTRAHPQRAEKVGFVNNLYYLRSPGFSSPDIVDETWQGYEQRLGDALDILLDRSVPSIDAETWLRVLVPFVAGLFVRGPEFKKQYESGEMMKSLILKKSGRMGRR